MGEDPDADVGAQIEEELTQAFGEIMARHETSMVIKWIALIETMDDTGERGLWTFASENNKAWDTVGMLQHALHLQQMQTLMPHDDQDE